MSQWADHGCTFVSGLTAPLTFPASSGRFPQTGDVIEGNSRKIMPLMGTILVRLRGFFDVFPGLRSSQAKSRRLVLCLSPRLCTYVPPYHPKDHLRQTNGSTTATLPSTNKRPPARKGNTKTLNFLNLGATADEYPHIHTLHWRKEDRCFRGERALHPAPNLARVARADPTGSGYKSSRALLLHRSCTSCRVELLEHGGILR
ncbi:hypothetical protein FA13DRAFT_1471108 [Coprinellus micaceus]|uniref:Uncharacterized protein n=1 Tax=Coprinellus micaceus TaxID=71717 RepID=A0A4Y7SLJ1_COPMI|nr:hypothetical protein FA13DRAFT_1471108 [Coprinellus micaceus]